MKALCLTLSFVFLASCKPHGELGLTPEQAVWESVLLASVENSHRQIYLSGATDAKWVRERSIKDVLTHPHYPESGLTDTRLLHRLLEVNAASASIRYKPIMTNVVMLPGEYASRPRFSDSKERCLVDVEPDAITVKQGERWFRPYYSLSKVAFSSDGAQALVKVGYF